MLTSQRTVAVVCAAALGLAMAGAGLLAQAGPRTEEARPTKPGPEAPADGRAKPADAEMHVIGVYGAKDGLVKPGRVAVEVRPTARPVVLVLTAYNAVTWHVKPADGARLRKVIVSGYFAQEVQGVPADVPVVNRSYYPSDGSRRHGGWFYAHEGDTPQWREMVRRVNGMTGLPLSSFQGESQGGSFVVDGERGRGFAQKGFMPPSPALREPAAKDVLAAAANAELHVVGIYAPDHQRPGRAVDVEVRPTDKPALLVLASYSEAVWRVQRAEGARLQAVIVGSPMPQEVEGLPAHVPVYYYCPDGSVFFGGGGLLQDRGSFWAYQGNTIEYRRLVEKLNDLTGRLVATFQGEYDGASFVVDGVRGRDFAQKERKPRQRLPRGPAPKEFLAACAGADLNVVSISSAEAGNGAPVDVEVRPTARPVVLALVAYSSVLWNVKVAPGARVQAVVIGGYFEQEFEGVPATIPVVYRAYFPSRKQGYFYGHDWDTPECQGLVEKLNDLTGLLVATFQGESRGRAFVVDGARGSQFAQKERKKKEPPKAEEDPAADVADVPARELRAAGDDDKQYFLIGPRKDDRPPAAGHGLLVILPGGDGSADFHPFVKRIYKYAVPEGYLAAQPVAVSWTPDQQVVWPTKTNPVARMKFSTEEFVEAVVKDVAAKHKLDRKRIFTLSWSSSGPAAYAISLGGRRTVTGSLVAMSVFRPELLPPLKEAGGHAYYLYHSPDDRVCPYRMAEQAKTSLTENRARVHLETYQGGHGWRGPLYNDIQRGLKWLEKNRETADRP